jgi:hypothetical protein
MRRSWRVNADGREIALIFEKHQRPLDRDEPRRGRTVRRRLGLLGLVMARHLVG